ncbi:MAG: hypothetical protein R3E56_00665 [Burkholderiaceae bacterium]
MNPAIPGDTGAEGKSQGCDQQHQAHNHPNAPVHDDLPFARFPHSQFPVNRFTDEPHQLQQHHQDAQQLEKENVNQQGDTDEHRQPVHPGDQGESHQCAALAWRKILWPGILETQQHPAQRSARQRTRALMQVGQIQQIAEDEVPVKAHEWAGIDGQGHHPARGGQKEHPVSERAIRRQTPDQGCHTGQCQLHRNARTGYRQPVPRIFQPPALPRVGVQHGQHHQKRHPHVRHPHSIPRCNKCVAQLMDGFRKEQGADITHGPGPGEVVHQCVAKNVPLARDQEKTQQSDGPYAPCQHRQAQALQKRLHRCQTRLGPHQWQPKKQVVVHQPFEERFLLALASSDQALDLRPVVDPQQLVVRQKHHQPAHVGQGDIERCLCIDFLDQCRRIKVGPMDQQFEVDPANAKEAVGHRVLNDPGWRAIVIGRGRKQNQLISDARQLDGFLGLLVDRDPGHVALDGLGLGHSPVHSLTVDKGRRNKK